MNEATMRKKILWILCLMLKLTITCSTTVSTQNCCSRTSIPCDVSEMQHQLEKAVNFTNKVIRTLNAGVGSANCPAQPEDCEAVYRCGSRSSGIYTVWPRNRILTHSVDVYCDMTTEGGAWTVIQRRGNFGRAKDYFYNDWNTYKEGFGDISQDFWIGNDLLFAFTNQKLYTLRFDLRDFGESKWAMYDKFWVDSEEYNYTLHVQGYMGNAGDSLYTHNGRQFTTKDRDNNWGGEAICALKYKGAWWYAINCHNSNLNGLYLNGSHTSFADGINWATWRGYHHSLPFTEMKIRPIFFKPHKDETSAVIPV